ncbi:MAG: zinc-dependent metalloprotease [Pseudomonadota bacterium]
MVRGFLLALLTCVMAGVALAHPDNEADEDIFLPLAFGDDGQLIATLPAPDDDGVSLRVIHAMRLTSGLGSNPIGLDRGWGSNGAIVLFRVSGGKLTAEVENHTYRASADNPLEKRAVAQSFGRSIIFATDIIDQGDETVTADISGLLLTDLLGLASALKEDDGGPFTLDKGRSRMTPGGVLMFPLNTEVDTEITFTSNDPGTEISMTAPYPGAVTLGVHHSFVALPEPGFAPRLADPRVGPISMPIYDFSAPLGGSITQSFALRHRLELKNPNNPDEGVVKPIVFYVDSGAPKAIRDALVEGAMWWAEGFEEAGFPGGYRVEVMPDDMHPLDVRYSVIQWVHRQTRGWSYGGNIRDPRTGEMLKGHVILGSQRVRQDRMIFEGLSGTEKTGTGQADDPIKLALARIRQLSAHEVGHAIGFGHNFAASAVGRASVMDYPAPWVIERQGALDFSQAYDVGLGDWDIATVKWLYGNPADGDAVVQQAMDEGLYLIEDPEGRGVGTGHINGAVWDNGSDPVDELDNVMRVRKVALENFGTDAAADGMPASRLREVLVPIYLYHRYQTAAAAKVIGGSSYQYAVIGQDEPLVEMAPKADQMAALAMVLSTLSPQALDMPESILEVLIPRSDPFQYVSREEFETGTDAIFDLTSAVETSADISLGALFAPARLERLAQNEARHGRKAPSIEAVLDEITNALFDPNTASMREEAIAAAVQSRAVAAFINADNPGASIAVRAALRGKMEQLADDLEDASDHGPLLADQLKSHLDRPAPATAPQPAGPKTPPGSPIGEDCWHCSGR